MWGLLALEPTHIGSGECLFHEWVQSPNPLALSPSIPGGPLCRCPLRPSTPKRFWEQAAHNFPRLSVLHLEGLTLLASPCAFSWERQEKPQASSKRWQFGSGDAACVQEALEKAQGASYSQTGTEGGGGEAGSLFPPSLDFVRPKEMLSWLPGQTPWTRAARPPPWSWCCQNLLFVFSIFLPYLLSPLLSCLPTWLLSQPGIPWLVREQSHSNVLNLNNHEKNNS